MRIWLGPIVDKAADIRAAVDFRFDSRVQRTTLFVARQLAHHRLHGMHNLTTPLQPIVFGLNRARLVIFSAVNEQVIAWKPGLERSRLLCAYRDSGQK